MQKLCLIFLVTVIVSVFLPWYSNIHYINELSDQLASEVNKIEVFNAEKKKKKELKNKELAELKRKRKKIIQDLKIMQRQVTLPNDQKALLRKLRQVGFLFNFYPSRYRVQMNPEVLKVIEYLADELSKFNESKTKLKNELSDIEESKSTENVHLKQFLKPASVKDKLWIKESDSLQHFEKLSIGINVDRLNNLKDIELYKTISGIDSKMGIVVLALSILSIVLLSNRNLSIFSFFLIAVGTGIILYAILKAPDIPVSEQFLNSLAFNDKLKYMDYGIFLACASSAIGVIFSFIANKGALVQFFASSRTNTASINIETNKVEKLEQKKNKSCPQCGERVEGDSKFCSHCGIEVDKIKKCNNCGAEIDPNSKFCTHCGSEKINN